MSSLHDFHTDKLKTEFQSILFIQNEVLKKRKILQEKLGELKGVYNDLVTRNTKKIFLFCLDSFYFQYKTLTLEMDNLKRYIAWINNRMYGDYYKLYNIILIQIAESSINVDMRSATADFKKYVPYKDLEPFYEYKMQDIIKLHGDILCIVDFLQSHLVCKQTSVCEYQDTPHAGITITSFIQTLEYENTLLREQIGLYVGYLEFFHNSQLQFLTKLFGRVQAFQREIEDDILTHHKQVSVEQPPSMDPSRNVLSLESFISAHPRDEPTELEKLLCEAEEFLDKGDELFSQWKLASDDSVSEFSVESRDKNIGAAAAAVASSNDDKADSDDDDDSKPNFGVTRIEPENEPAEF
jgi:hypothetical protein